MLFSLLQILHGQSCRFDSPQSAPEKDGIHGIVAPTAQILMVEYRKEPLPLLCCQPVAHPRSVFLDSP